MNNFNSSCSPWTWTCDS